jgi:hypothetical protein
MSALDGPSRAFAEGLATQARRAGLQTAHAYYSPSHRRWIVRVPTQRFGGPPAYLHDGRDLAFMVDDEQRRRAA